MLKEKQRSSSSILFELLEPLLADKEKLSHLITTDQKKLNENLLLSNEERERITERISKTQKILAKLQDPDSDQAKLAQILTLEEKIKLLQALHDRNTARARWIKFLSKFTSPVQTVSGQASFALSMYTEVPFLSFFISLNTLMLRFIRFFIERRLLVEGQYLEDALAEFFESPIANSLFADINIPLTSKPTIPFYNVVFDPGMKFEERKKYVNWDIPNLFSSVVSQSLSTLKFVNLLIPFVAGSTLSITTTITGSIFPLITSAIGFYIQSRVMRIMLKSRSAEVKRLLEEDFANLEKMITEAEGAKETEIKGWLTKLRAETSYSEKIAALANLSKTDKYAKNLDSFRSLNREIGFQKWGIFFNAIGTTASIALSTVNILILTGVITGAPIWLPYIPAAILGAAILTGMYIALRKATRATRKWNAATEAANDGKEFIKQTLDRETLAPKLAQNNLDPSYLDSFEKGSADFWRISAQEAKDRALTTLIWSVAASAVLTAVSIGIGLVSLTAPALALPLLTFVLPAAIFGAFALVAIGFLVKASITYAKKANEAKGNNSAAFLDEATPRFRSSTYTKLPTSEHTGRVVVHSFESTKGKHSPLDQSPGGYAPAGLELGLGAANERPTFY